MNIISFISQRLVPKKDTAHISKPIVTVATTAISLGLAVMIISVSIIIGFKTTIGSKVFGFSSHIQILNFDSNSSFESVPIRKDTVLIQNLSAEKGIQHIQTYATKPGIIKTTKAVKGIIVKGITGDVNPRFFDEFNVEGSMLRLTDSITNDVLVSKRIADMLQLSVGDSFVTTFIPNEPKKRPRKRQFTIAGIYATHLQEIDDRFIIADLRHIQRLNNWDDEQISGYEVFLQSHSRIDHYKELIQNEIGFDVSPNSQRLQVRTLKETIPQIFDWLELLNMNAWVIIILMLVVASMNMIIGLLVIILEKTSNIGLFKTMGANNWFIQKIFLFIGGSLIGRGLLWGNIIGLSVCIIQHYFKLIPLDAETYFMSYIPIEISVISILALNVGTLLFTMLMLLLPSHIISKISPAESVKFT